LACAKVFFVCKKIKVSELMQACVSPVGSD